MRTTFADARNTSEVVGGGSLEGAGNVGTWIGGGWVSARVLVKPVEAWPCL
jgi:hypothetical protein